MRDLQRPFRALLVDLRAFRPRRPFPDRLLHRDGAVERAHAQRRVEHLAHVSAQLRPVQRLRALRGRVQLEQPPGQRLEPPGPVLHGARLVLGGHGELLEDAGVVHLLPRLLGPLEQRVVLLPDLVEALRVGLADLVEGLAQLLVQRALHAPHLLALLARLQHRLPVLALHRLRVRVRRRHD